MAGPKYYYHPPMPYVYDWRGRAYGAGQLNSRTNSEMGGVMDAVKSPIGIGALVLGAVLLYPKLFGKKRR